MTLTFDEMIQMGDLNLCLDEVAAVLKKHKVAGLCTIADGKGMSRFCAIIENKDVDWSAIYIEPDPPQIRIKAQAKSGPKTELVKLERTINMVSHLHDVLEKQFKMLGGLMEILGRNTHIERGKGTWGR
jgi:hypothetical protein